MKINLILILLTVYLFSLSCNPGLAQGPPIYTDTPILLGLEGSGIRTFGKFIKKEQANIYVQPIVFPYNITANVLVGVIIPFLNKNPDNIDAHFGVGDVALFVKKTLYKKDGKAKTLRFVGKVKQVFPTGNTTEAPALGEDSYQTLLGVVTGYITTKIGLYSEIGYNITSNGKSDNFIYNFAVGYPLLAQQYPARQVNLFLELNGEYLLETNANILFVSPGVQWITGRRLLIESGVQLPIVEQIAETQQTVFTFTFGIRVLLF